MYEDTGSYSSLLSLVNENIKPCGRSRHSRTRTCDFKDVNRVYGNRLKINRVA